MAFISNIYDAFTPDSGLGIYYVYRLFGISTGTAI